MANGQPDSGYMMQLGDPSTGSFTFQIGTAAYSKLTRTDAWRWVTQDRINNDPQEQFVGKGSTVFVIEGVIFTSFNPGAGIAGSTTTAVGTKQLDVIRAIADSGSPQNLVDGRGNIFGQVVVVEIREENEVFLVNGAPQKQTFVITLRSFGKRQAPLLPNLNPFVPASDNGVLSSFADLAKTNPYAAQVASTLVNNGVSTTDAQTDGLATEAAQAANNSNLSQADASSLAIIMGKNYGLTGQGFANGLAFLPSAFNSSNWNDKSSVIGTGLPDLNSVLETNLGMSGDSEGEAALGVFSVIPSGTSDRGVFLSNFAAQVQDVLGLSADALDGTGVVTDTSTMNSDTSQRFSDLMSQLSALQSSDPDKYSSLFPSGEFTELNAVVSAQAEGSLPTDMGQLQNSLTKQ